MDVPVRRDHTPDLVWPQGGRDPRAVPCVLRSRDLRRGQKRLLRGPIWNFLCLEIEIPNTGDWRLATAGVGDGFAVRSRFCVFRLAQDGDTVTFATGRCLDRIVADGGALRFRSRRVDILQVLPL